MSILQMVEVWKHRFSHPQQTVMLALADHANDFGGNIFPSVDYLAWKTEYSRRTVQNILSDLRACGILEVVKEARWNSPNEYRINWKKGTLKKPYVRGAIFAPLQTGGAAPVQEGCSSGAEGCSSGALGVQRAAPEPSLTITTTVKEPSKKKNKFSPEKIDLPSFIDPALWLDWCQHRSEIKDPLTPTSTKRQLTMLAKTPTHANAMITKSIENGWKGLFPLSERDASNELSGRGDLNAANRRILKTAQNMYAAIGGDDDDLR